MQDWIIFQSVDWISIWKLYASLFISVFIVSGLPLRVWMIRASDVASPNKTWLFSWILASLFIFAAPFASLPGALLVSLLGGTRAVESFFMSVPITVSIGLAGSIVDVLLLRFLWGESITSKRFKLVFAANAANVAIAIGVVIEWLLIYPPRVIATLAC